MPPRDPDAYKKRGKFLSSTFSRAEFWGRPLDIPDKVTISNPIYGFSEIEILKVLFGKRKAGIFLNRVSKLRGDMFFRSRFALDHKMYLRAKQLGYDAIVLMTERGRISLNKNRKPRSIELNLLNV